jgi:hypothetical protein
LDIFRRWNFGGGQEHSFKMLCVFLSEHLNAAVEAASDKFALSSPIASAGKEESVVNNNKADVERNIMTDELKALIVEDQRLFSKYLRGLESILEDGVKVEVADFGTGNGRNGIS